MEQVPEKLDEKLINQLSALFGQIAKGEMQRNRIERDPGIARKNRIIIQTLSKSNTHTRADVKSVPLTENVELKMFLEKLCRCNRRKKYIFV